MEIKIALAGNPNCGKTTLLTHSRVPISLSVTGPA